MLNRKLLLRISVIVLLFGMTVIACNAQSNSGIEGIWDFGEEGIWKFEKGKVQMFDEDGLFDDEYQYTIKGNILVIDGDEEGKFSIKGNTLTLTIDGETMTGTKIIASPSSSLVGRWDYEDGDKEGKLKKLQLLKDGTGICDGISIKWKTEGNLLIIQSSWVGLSCEYIIIGSRLTLIYDKDDYESAVFVKR